MTKPSSIASNPVLRLLQRMVLLPTMVLSACCSSGTASEKPNVLLILCDDLGYGDVRALNPQKGKIPTPHMDRLSAQGMRFTDAHTSSSVCTPSRYSILTGRYAWRTRLQSGVTGGFSPPLIDSKRLTLPQVFRRNGYRTACLGKWHLGMTFAAMPGVRFNDSMDEPGSGRFDPAQPIADGPTTRGFDYFYGISSSLDMPPFAFIENDHFTQAPTATKTWLRTGPAAPDFDAAEVLPALTHQATRYLAECASKPQPFFLYLSLTSPHTPILPGKTFQGRSGLNPYADFVMATDQAIGDVLNALDRNHLAESTLVFLTSDNGCSPAAGVDELIAKGHYPSARFRGYKADIFDGGHRVPLLAHWPGRIAPGTSSDRLTCLTDFMATAAELLGENLPASSGEDSVSFLAALQGRPAPPRPAVVHHSFNGSFAIRDACWKLLLCRDSGGWSEPKPGSRDARVLPEFQLYDLGRDEAERTNRIADHPEMAACLHGILKKFIATGRSTPGMPLANDVPVIIPEFNPTAIKP